MSRVFNLSRSFFIVSNVSTEGYTFFDIDSFYTRKGGMVVGHAEKGMHSMLMLKK